MTKQQRKHLKTLIEEFWVYESAWDATPQAKVAARQLQKFLGYKTPWDKARKR